MVFTKRRFARTQFAIYHRYGFFRSLFGRPKTTKVVLTILGSLLVSALWWVIDHRNAHAWLQERTSIFDNLASTVIEVAVIIFLVIIFLIIRIFSEAETHRVNLDIDGCDNQKIIFTRHMRVKLEIVKEHYSLPEQIQSLHRWLPVEKDEYFLMEAGPLDLPKLSLRKVSLKDNELTLFLGSASYFDIFFTHYCPDLLLSKEAYHENSNHWTTLRKSVQPAIRSYYEMQISDFSNSSNSSCAVFEPSYLLPNPLGISGILLLRFFGSDTEYLLMARRGRDTIGSRGQLDWAFSGLQESLSRAHSKEFTVEEFGKVELEDEVLSQFSSLRNHKADVSPLGLTFSSRYLSQPELIVLYQFSKVDRVAFSKELNSQRFELIAFDEASSKFREKNIKDLCLSGLELLKEAKRGLHSLS